MAMEYDYLSEDEGARNRLYYICLMDESLSVHDEETMSTSRKQFDMLFS